MAINLAEELEKNIKIADKGRKTWIGLCEEFNIDEECKVLIFSEEDNLLNYKALSILKQFTKEKDIKNILIISNQEIIKKVGGLFFDGNIKFIFMDISYIDSIIKLYELYMFTDKLIIVSLDKPEGREASNIIEKELMSLEEVVSIGIFSVKEYENKIEPKYAGNDVDVIEFLNVKGD